MTKEDIEYIDEVYKKRDTWVRPDVKRIIRLYNEYIPDGVHIFHKVNENICACNLRPYLIQLWKKMDSNGLFRVDTTAQPPKKNTGKKTKNKSVNVSPGT